MTRRADGRKSSRACYGRTRPLHDAPQETLFLMTYGVEAVIPMETSHPTSRTDMFQVGENNQLLCKHLDLIEENHDMALVRLANYQ